MIKHFVKERRNLLFQTEKAEVIVKTNTHINAMDQNEEKVKANRLKQPIVLLEPPDHRYVDPSNGADKGSDKGADKGAAVAFQGSLLSEDDNRLLGLPRLSERRSSCRDLRRFQRRRGSSFAEYFDVDFGQSLLSRKQFSRKNSYAADLAQRLENTTSNHNGNEARIDGEGQSLLNVLPCNWFFSNPDESAATFSNVAESGRTRPSLIVMLSEDGQKISLLQVARENFTAVSTVKELSLGAPLSQ